MPPRRYPRRFVCRVARISLARFRARVLTSAGTTTRPAWRQARMV